MEVRADVPLHHGRPSLLGQPLLRLASSRARRAALLRRDSLTRKRDQVNILCLPQLFGIGCVILVRILVVVDMATAGVLLLA